MTNEHQNDGQHPGQADWMPRHVVREACRAELRAWCQAARKPSRVAAATAAAVTISGITAASVTSSWTTEAAPTALVRPGADGRQAGPPTARPAKPTSSPHASAAQHRATAQHRPHGAASTHIRRVAKHAPQRSPSPPAKPYRIYDSVIPATIPAGQDVAAYSDGAYAASPSALARHGRVLWIDANGTDPNANALDVEPGDATPAAAAAWVAARLTKHPHDVAIVYTYRAWWPAVQAAINALPQRMRSRVRYWIADPTGYPHMVPGASATQWYWGPAYDITTAEPGFWR